MKATANTHTQFLPQNLIMVDCEMTGVREDRDHLLQAAFTMLDFQNGQYVETKEPLVLYMPYAGQPENDFQKKFLTHIFKKCNESTLTPEQGKEQLHAWLGELKGKVTPVGDCVPTDIAFLKAAGLVDRPDIDDDGPIPGTFHYEFFDLNSVKAFARQLKGEKFAISGLDEDNIHDALVDCRNQTIELNAFVNVLLSPTENGAEKTQSAAGDTPNWTTEILWDQINWQDSYQDLFPGFSEEPEVAENDAYYTSRENAVEDANNIIGLFQAIPDPAPIYRVVGAKAAEHIDTEYPGEYWSFDRQSALRFGQRNVSGEKYLMTAKVPKKAVDWDRTLSAYLSYSGIGDGESENELYIPIGNQKHIKDLKIQKVAGSKQKVKAGWFDDRTEEIFSQGGCWDLALELEKDGMEFAVIEDINYGEKDYPHAFAMDGDRAVDIFGRTTLPKIQAKWSKLLGREVRVLRGAEAKQAVNVKGHPETRRLARKTIEENPEFFFGKNRPVTSTTTETAPSIAWVLEMLERMHFTPEELGEIETGYVMGSIAKGKAKPDSDMDITLISNTLDSSAAEDLSNTILDVIEHSVKWNGRTLDIQVWSRNDPRLAKYSKIPLEMNRDVPLVRHAQGGIIEAGAFKEMQIDNTDPLQRFWDAAPYPHTLPVQVTEDLPLELQPALAEGFRDEDRLIGLYRKDAVRCDTFQDFQSLLDRIMLAEGYTEDLRSGLAGFLNILRTDDGRESL